MSFKDTFGVEYSDDRQTLLKCPTSLSGSYMVSPLVRIIGEGAFKGCNKLEEIIFPEGVEVIEKDALFGCVNLKNIVLPNNPTSFKPPRLISCDSLREIRMPDDFKFPVFVDCINLDKVYVNDTNKYFRSENGVIYNRDKTVLYFFPRNYEGTFKLPNSVETIYHPRAISNCSKLTNLVLSESFQSFGLGNSTLNPRGCTSGCPSLNRIEINDRNNLFCSIDGVLYSKDKTIIVRCPEGKAGNYKIIDSVHEILCRSFLNCKNLLNITIPKSVTKIGISAFWGCENITQLYIPSNTLDIEVTAFPLNLKNLEINLDNPVYYTKDGVLFKAVGTTLSRESKKTSIIPVSLEWFPKVHSINKYIVPNNVESINYEAFRHVENLTLVFTRYVPITRTGQYKYDFVWSKGRILVPTGTKQWFVNGGYPQESIVEDHIIDNGIIKQTKSLDCKGFAAIAGMEKLKEKLRTDIIKVLKDPNRARRFGISIPNGILLYGPPGCGKTFFAEKLAEEIGCNYMNVKCSDVASPYIHGGQGKIATMFNEARKNAPTLLFLDEVDAMITDRGKHTTVSESGEVNEFLAQLNNCGQDGVTVIAATNKPDLIDKAALRTGRLALHYYIPQPDFETRKQLFEINLQNRAVDSYIDYGRLAQMTENYSCSDIREIVDNAGRIAFGSDSDCITQCMLESACLGLKSHLTLDAIKKYESIRDRFEK